MEMMLVGQNEEKAVGDLITLSVYIISHINGLGNRCSLAKQSRMEGVLWLLPVKNCYSILPDFNTVLTVKDSLIGNSHSHTNTLSGKCPFVFATHLGFSAQQSARKVRRQEGR